MSKTLFALPAELAKPVACGWLTRQAASTALLNASLKAIREGTKPGEDQDPFSTRDFLLHLLDQHVARIAIARELAAYRIEQMCWRRGKAGEPRVDILAEAKELNRVGGHFYTPVQIAALVADTLAAVGRWQERPRDVTP